MANATETKKTDSDAMAVQPWEIEADHPRNADLLLQAVPGVRLRSSISASKPVRDWKTGQMMIPPDQAAYLGQFPPVPGMRIAVNPAKLTYVVSDPLADDEQTCERIKRAMDANGPFRSVGKIRGVETKRGTLDVHRIKTLVREMLWLVEAGEAKVTKGNKPTMEEIERLPGEFLLNPGSRVHNNQPRYESQWDVWLEQLTKAGG